MFIQSHTEIYSYKSFTKIWRDVFPKVKIREYKNVTGKCEVCEACKSMMSGSRSKAHRILVRQYKILHRAYYMGEKLLYYQRRAEAANSDGEIGSIIIDKMGTHATQLPLLSNLNSLTDHFGVAVTGAISHGTNETAFYLSTPNVSTGASYTIHCILSELRKLYLKNKQKRLKKIYIEIDGASDNVAKAVVAAIEHLVFKEFCPNIILARLPVGHTHEDIDSRFGKIWTFVRNRHVYTFDGFCSIIREAFANDDHVSVQPVFAILNYKEYYDQFIDENLKALYSKMENTQLYFKVQPVRETDLQDSASNLLVRTNYRKCGQDYTVFLRDNDVEDGVNTSHVKTYRPVILKSEWIPENAKNVSCPFPQSCSIKCPCRERGPGISFLKYQPTGRPKPMSFEKGWFRAFSTFVDKIRFFFNRRNEEKLAEYWQNFASHRMPASELVEDFIKDHDIDSPLGQYLYGNLSFGGPTPYSQSGGDTTEVSMITGFSHSHHRNRATPFDLSLMAHIEQCKQTIPWSGHREVYKNWEFDSPFMLQRIQLIRGTGATKKVQKGTCVATCKEDSNEGKYKSSILVKVILIANKVYIILCLHT